MPSQDAQVHYDLGFAYAEMKLFGDAIRELEIALAVDPEHDRAASAIELLKRLRQLNDDIPPKSEPPVLQ